MNSKIVLIICLVILVEFDTNGANGPFGFFSFWQPGPIQVHNKPRESPKSWVSSFNYNPFSGLFVKQPSLGQYDSFTSFLAPMTAQHSPETSARREKMEKAMNDTKEKVKAATKKMADKYAPAVNQSLMRAATFDKQILTATGDYVEDILDYSANATVQGTKKLTNTSTTDTPP